MRVLRASSQQGECVVQCDDTDDIRCDRLLLAVGRVAVTDRERSADEARLRLDVLRLAGGTVTREAAGSSLREG
jgi:pyruvate/2-oxoglutarate dehydrogenase complex dihydrolipoamide dehydrogenase (E3) component